MKRVFLISFTVAVAISFTACYCHNAAATDTFRDLISAAKLKANIMNSYTPHTLFVEKKKKKKYEIRVGFKINRNVYD